MEVSPDGRRARPPPPDLRLRAAEKRLAELPEKATWIWMDGSADGKVRNGGGGAVIVLPDSDTREVRIATDTPCSSTRAELFAPRAAQEELANMGTATPLNW